VAGGRNGRNRAALLRLGRTRRCAPRPREDRAARLGRDQLRRHRVLTNCSLQQAQRDSCPLDTRAVAGGDAATGGAPVRRIVSNRVFASCSSHESSLLFYPFDALIRGKVLCPRGSHQVLPGHEYSPSSPLHTLQAVGSEGKTWPDVSNTSPRVMFRSHQTRTEERCKTRRLER
jgi:hypothetical protein